MGRGAMLFPRIPWRIGVLKDCALYTGVARYGPLPRCLIDAIHITDQAVAGGVTKAPHQKIWRHSSKVLESIAGIFVNRPIRGHIM